MRFYTAHTAQRRGNLLPLKRLWEHGHESPAWLITNSRRIGDEVLDEIGLEEIAAIKIDVEGTELQVLTGLAQTLQKKKPALIFEVLPNFYGHDRLMQDAEICSRNTSIAERLYKYLSDAGYEIRQINRCGDDIPIHKFDLDNRIDYIGSDYIASPRR